MAADVESEALILDCTREATDVLWILLQYDDPTPFSCELVTRGETRRSGSDNDDVALRFGIQNISRFPLQFIN